MATDTTDNLALTTVEAGDVLPEAVSKTNFEVLDQYVAARSLTNKSGGTVPANSVVVVDTTADDAFTTTTSAGATKVAGVTQASILNNAAGIVKQYGITSLLVDAATSRGNWLTTGTTAGQATPSSATNAPAGTFAIALSATVGAGTVTALLLLQVGAAVVSRVLDIPAFATVSPATNGAADGSTTGTNFTYATKDFDQTTEEHIDFQIVIPSTYSGGNLTWTFYWTAASGTGTVSWEVNVLGISNDEVLDSALTDVGSATDTLIATGDVHVVSVEQTGTLPTASDILAVRISRDVAADTLNADAKLLRVTVGFEA